MDWCWVFRQIKSLSAYSRLEYEAYDKITGYESKKFDLKIPKSFIISSQLS